MLKLEEVILVLIRCRMVSKKTYARGSYSNINSRIEIILRYLQKKTENLHQRKKKDATA